MKLFHKKYLEVFFLIFILYIPVGVYAQEVIIYPTYPGTGIRDLSQPRKVIEDGVMYETFPGTDLKDLSAPRYIIEDGGIYETFPGTDIIDLDGDSYDYDGYSIDE